MIDSNPKFQIFSAAGWRENRIRNFGKTMEKVLRFHFFILEDGTPDKFGKQTQTESNESTSVADNGEKRTMGHILNV